LKKIFMDPKPRMLKDRINKTPAVRRIPFNPERERETGKKLSHFKGKR
jgi:hypothetical protein